MISMADAAEWRSLGRQLAPGLFLTFVWFLLSVIGFMVVDPYGVIDRPLIEGFNDVKPLRFANQRIYKPIWFLRGDYNGIILGASRELIGMDPRSAPLREQGRRFYNFAMVDERPYESAQIAEFAVASRPIRTIVIDLEFTRYNLDPKVLAPLPFYPKTGSIVAWALRQEALAAVSFQGISDSFDTFRASEERQVLAYHHTREGLEEYPSHSPDLQYNYEAAFANGLSIYLNLVLPKVADQSSDWTKRGFDHSSLKKSSIWQPRMELASLRLSAHTTHC